MTKLRQFTTQTQIPAGIFSGIEAFWHNGEKWVIANGTVQRFHEAPSTVQQPIWRAFTNDKQSLAYLAKMGLTKASETFDKWYRCVIGGIDHVPDILNDKFSPDAYNNMCADHTCPHRGRLCSRATNLKNFEIETIVALKSAKNMKQAAEAIHVSLPAIKSRIAKMHINLNVPNTVALMATATQLGI